MDVTIHPKMARHRFCPMAMFKTRHLATANTRAVSRQSAVGRIEPQGDALLLELPVGHGRLGKEADGNPNRAARFRIR